MWDSKLTELGGCFKERQYKIINMRWLGPPWKETAQWEALELPQLPHEVTSVLHIRFMFARIWLLPFHGQISLLIYSRKTASEKYIIENKFLSIIKYILLSFVYQVNKSVKTMYHLSSLKRQSAPACPTKGEPRMPWPSHTLLWDPAWSPAF